jgi:hypothetical protein
VFEELLTVFNYSVLSFGVAIKFHLNRTLEYVTILTMGYWPVVGNHSSPHEEGVKGSTATKCLKEVQSPTVGF